MQANQAGIRKACCETGFKLRCQVDFRHQEQRLLPGSQRTLNQAKIDFGLAAAGYSVQQIGTEAAGAFGHCP
jgi:hypothetical protein